MKALTIFEKSDNTRFLCSLRRKNYMGINWNKLAVSYKSMVVSSVESEHFSLSQFRQKMFF